MNLLLTTLSAALGALTSQSPVVPPPSDAAGTMVVCGSSVPAPATLPPTDIGPVLLSLVLCFDRQGHSSTVEPQTYLFYVHTRPSEPSRGRWVSYDTDLETRLREDFRRLWATQFLDDLVIEVLDRPLANGVVGKIAVFHLEERQRVKIVDYEGLSAIDRSAIDEALKERGVEMRLDTFIDAAVLRRVGTAIRDLYALKGYRFADVTPSIKPIAGGSRAVYLTFTITEGPQTAIRDVTFVGNRAVDDDVLETALRRNRAHGLGAVLRGGSAYKEAEWAEDAQNVVDAYRARGFVSVRVDMPEVRPLYDSPDGRTRWVQLRVPVHEGIRYRVATVSFEGIDSNEQAVLAPAFGLKPGDVYDERRVRKGLERARELFGAYGYFEFTGYPDLQQRPAETGPEATGHATGDGLVDVVMRLDKGQQYYVNRITIVGNTTTHDHVIRRELAIAEGGLFNTAGLKTSIRRLNQLGYFKPLDDKAIAVEKAAADDGQRVDVRLTIEEQNRNQLSFGAGVSQYEGFYGNVSFTTTNFRGRGESVTLGLQKGTRSNNNQVAFTEPFIFDRNVSLSTSVYSRKVDYQLYSSTVDYSEARAGFVVTAGRPLFRFARMFLSYGYEVAHTASSHALVDLFETSATAVSVLSDGRHVQSQVTPSFVYDTVDSPFNPRRGTRLSATYEYSGGIFGGTTHFVKPELSAVRYVPLTTRTAVGLRAQAGWIVRGGSSTLPYYLRYFLGGETQIRGTDIRSVGPQTSTGAALGGTRFVLFNAEYYYDIHPMVRALLFHDAGQAFAEDDRMNLRQLRTSSGAELRVTVPMLNVPFRLIYAWNVYRDARQPARTFRFAVGTTF